MGSCISQDVKSKNPTRTQSRIYKIRYDESLKEEDDNTSAHGDGGARVRLEGNSVFASMFTQKGMKGINQDAMTVWENFNGEKDVLFCGVFDGHGPSGHTVARHIRDTLPYRLSSAFRQSQLINGCNHSGPGLSSYNTKESHEDTSNPNPVLLSTWASSFVESFKETDDELVSNPAIDSFCSGTTAVTVIKQEDHLIIANLGDSRAIMCTRGNRNELIPDQLTVDLKPSLPGECERITKCKGRVHASPDEPDVQRLWLPEHDDMGLAMSRAFGDFCLKRCGLIAVPEVTCRKLTDRDEFVVLASDGVWDVLSNTEVIQIVASAAKRSMAAKLLVEKAVRAWRYRYPGSKTDDCTAICMFFKKPSPRPSKTTLESTNSWTIESWHSCRIIEVTGEPSSKSTVADAKEEYTALEGDTRVNSILSIPRFSLSWRKSAKEVESILV
uniref:PPM-type phosphatase domain-containing protein n=1 Tax=Kalanchoe fedtschenkoi TaxID=63787 RepID=A0A7N0T628_KALFE